MLTKADRLLAEFASQQHSVFSYVQAIDLGLSASQADRRGADDWERLHEGVFRLRGAPSTTRGDLFAACLAASHPAAVSHRSAAWLYGLPGGRDNIVEITCRRWKRTRKPLLVVHESARFDDRDIGDIEGIPVVRAERLVLELAGLIPNPNYVETVIHAARRKRLLTFDSPLETFERLARRGVKGVRAMRVALDRWDPSQRPTESEMETLLLQTLRAHGIPEPVLQFEVRDDNGRFVARTDAALPQWRITVDYDSKQEHSDEFQVARDARRRDEIIASGFLPLTARHGDLVRGGDDLVGRIRRVAKRYLRT